MEYLTVPNFEKYQHYKERRPPWIKLYWSYLCSPNVYPLSDVCKFHVVAIMSLASQYDNRIPFNKGWIAHAIHANSRINWDAILTSGLIVCVQDASAPLAGCAQVPIVETETYKEETETDVKRALARVKRSRKAPDDFTVTEQMRELALQETPDADIEAETRAFMDHEFEKPKSDWPGTWRNWIRNSTKFRRSAAQKRETVEDRNQQVLREFKENGR